MWWTALLVALVVGMTAASGAEADQSADFYVSPHGSDRWSGTRPDVRAGGSDGPFATLERARDAVRSLKASRHGHPVTVLMRGGVYRLSRPLVFQPEDSGTADAPVIYAAYPGERPVISGGRQIRGWKRGADDLWTTRLPDVAAGHVYFRQLFVNGRRRERARLPHKGWYTATGAADASTSNWAASVAGHPTEEAAKRSFRFRPGDISPSWVNLPDVEIVVLQYWMAARLRIQAIDEARSSVLFTGGSWRPLTWSFGYYAENVFEGLGAPGSWYLDRKTGTLTYHALPGEDVTTADVVAPEIEQLVCLKGDPEGRRAVQRIIFRGLTFEHTAYPLPDQGYAYSQAELPVPAAINAVGARACAIERCAIAHLGGWAIELGRACKGNRVEGSDISDVGAGCVKVGEPDDPHSDAAEAEGTVISDNRMADGCPVYLGAPAVWIGQSGRNTVSHNEISGQFMWAASVGWNWGYFPLNRSRDNIVEKNHVHDLGTGTLGTHGALYCLGVSPGTVLRGNYIHDVHSTDAWGAGEGIILDNGCSGILVENNVVHNAVSGGWGCNFNCDGNIIQNNIFVNGTRYQLTRYGDAPDGPPPPNGEVFARNIVVWEKGPLFSEKDWWSFATLWNYNLYWNGGKEPIRFLRYTFDEWKAKGLDRDSLIADPRFATLTQHDYSLLPDSPALKLGFRPIDLRDVGPRPGRGPSTAR